MLSNHAKILAIYIFFLHRLIFEAKVRLLTESVHLKEQRNFKSSEGREGDINTTLLGDKIECGCVKFMPCHRTVLKPIG